MCQNSLPSGLGRSLGTKISGRSGRPWGMFSGFYKTRQILLSNSANCTVLRAVVFTQYRPVTDGIAIASSACNASIAARCKNVDTGKLDRPFTILYTSIRSALFLRSSKVHNPSRRKRSYVLYCYHELVNKDLYIV